MTNLIKMPKRFDYSASKEFNAAIGAALDEAANQQIKLDCVQMDYIDSAGIGLLVMAHKKALSKSATIEVIRSKPSIKEIFLLANLQKIISIN